MHAIVPLSATAYLSTGILIYGTYLQLFAMAIRREMECTPPVRQKRLG